MMSRSVNDSASKLKVLSCFDLVLNTSEKILMGLLCEVLDLSFPTSRRTMSWSLNLTSATFDLDLSFSPPSLSNLGRIRRYGLAESASNLIRLIFLSAISFCKKKVS